MPLPTEALPYFTMERNLILQAGAGTGKTHTLVTLALHLLSGANARRRPVAPARMVALTFTEKAGAEMRERLQHRMAPLAATGDLSREPELARSFRALGIAPPAAAFWTRLRRDVSLATVGTFHGFCALQLRRFAPEAGLDPGFAVLDEEDSRALFEDAVDGYVRRALAEGDVNVKALVDEFGLSDDRESGLLDVSRAVLARLAEEGREPSSLLDARFDDAAAAAALRARSENLRDAIRALSAMSPKVLARLGSTPGDMDAVAAEVSAEHGEKSLERLQLLRKSFRKPVGPDGERVETVDEATREARAALARVRAAPLGRAFIDVLSRIDARYREAKAAREALDFSDLQRRLRDLLHQNRAVRRELKARIEALLVDEFQDTSRLQLELVALLSESRGTEAELAGADVAESVRWEPGFLCAVGDRKQSIYEFRGADVAVFSALHASLCGPNASAPARIEHLQRSFRSRPRLVACVNEIFRRAMPAALQPFEVAFGPGDALDAARVDPAPDDSGPLAEILEASGERAEDQRADEAERIAERIARMLEDPADPTRVRDADDRLRRVEGRDVTILFRRLTNLDVYRRALSARGLAHVVVGGGGFFEAREVLDGWSLLTAIADPWNASASIAVLRGPWCGLSDPTLLQLSFDEAGRRRAPTLGRLIAGSPAASGAERERLQRVLSFIRRYSPEFDRIGPAGVLSRAIEELDYLSVAARTSEADAVAANVGKLLETLARLEERSSSARGAIRLLDERIRAAQREPNATVAEESDARSIRMMSIHQSKGLQFPVVFIADCGAVSPGERDRVAYDRDLGLGLNVRFANGELVGMPELSGIRDRLAARSAAETLRLLYVAATRARDYLVFSGGMNRGSWLELAAALGPAMVRHLPPTPLAPPAHVPVPRPPIAPMIPQVAELSPIRVTTVTATVTRLQDFASCPERYRLRHDVGLAEHPPAAIAEDVGEEDVDAPLDVFARGTLAHRLLEVLDYPAASRDEVYERLVRAVRAEGHAPERPEIASILEDVEAFFETPFARELSALPSARRLRETPFFLALDLGDGRRLQVKGQVDLVALTSEGVSIVDYKHARRRAQADEQYAFQLQSYAVAVREMLGRTELPVKVGLAFLRERENAVGLQPLRHEQIDAHLELLKVLGRQLVDAHATARWERRPRDRCVEMGCGYLARCHPRANPASAAEGHPLLVVHHVGNDPPGDGGDAIDGAGDVETDVPATERHRR